MGFARTGEYGGGGGIRTHGSGKPEQRFSSSLHSVRHRPQPSATDTNSRVCVPHRPLTIAVNRRGCCQRCCQSGRQRRPLYVCERMPREVLRRTEKGNGNHDRVAVRPPHYCGTRTHDLRFTKPLATVTIRDLLCHRVLSVSETGPLRVIWCYPVSSRATRNGGKTVAPAFEDRGVRWSDCKGERE